LWDFLLPSFQQIELLLVVLLPRMKRWMVLQLPRGTVA
jgi:hypothetical protein